MVALLELKSRARESRRGDLGRLLAYAWLGYSAHDLAPHEITLFLVVPRVNEARRWSNLLGLAAPAKKRRR